MKPRWRCRAHYYILAGLADEVAEFLSAVIATGGDKEITDRKRAVQTTIKRHSENGQVTGWPKATEYFEEKIISKAREWLGANDNLYGLEMAEFVTEEWPTPEPLSTSLKPVEKFDFNLLPGPFKAWISDISHRMQCPPDYPAIGSMVTLAAVVGRKIGICPKQRDDWTVVPNLWGVSIGRPSVMKTPTLEEAIKPLKRLEIEAKESYQEALAVFEADKQLADIVKDEAKKQAAAKYKDGKETEAQGLLMEAQERVPEQPGRKRYVINDTSVEKLGEILNENPNGVLLARDELYGFLRSIDREDRTNDRAFYLEAFNGTGRYTYDRIGRGTIDIDAVTVSIIGCITPSKFQPYLHHALKGGTGDDGMVQRLQLAVYPDTPKDWQYIDQWPDKDAKNTAYQVFKQLADWRPKKETEPDEMPVLRFTPEAQTIFIEWLTELEQEIRSDDIHPAIESHLSKYRSLIPSPALIIHLTENGEQTPVGETALLKACAWSDYLKSHAERIYGMGVDAERVNAKAIVNKIKQQKLLDGFTPRLVQKGGWSGLSSMDDIRKALCMLCEMGFLREEVLLTGGLTSIRYRINPCIFLETGG